MSKVYEDAFDGYDYTKGRYSLRTFTVTGKSNELIIQQHKDGTYVTDYKKIEFEFIELPFVIKEVEVDNVIVNLESVQKKPESSILIIPNDFKEIHVIG